jgi:hypothetical protein
LNRRLVGPQSRPGQYGILKILDHIWGSNSSLSIFHSVDFRYRDYTIPALIKRKNVERIGIMRERIC